MRVCKECGEEFSLTSPEKQRSGGLIIHCPDCSEETEVKYLGFRSGDGKSAGLTVLKFSSEEDKSEYADMWRVNSGMLVGKQCQLKYQKRTPNVSFEKIHESGLGMNHKGKADQPIFTRHKMSYKFKDVDGTECGLYMAYGDDEFYDPGAPLDEDDPDCNARLAMLACQENELFLNKRMAHELIKRLQFFVDNGRLPNEAPPKNFESQDGKSGGVHTPDEKKHEEQQLYAVMGTKSELYAITDCEIVAEKFLEDYNDETGDEADIVPITANTALWSADEPEYSSSHKEYYTEG